MINTPMKKTGTSRETPRWRCKNKACSAPGISDYKYIFNLYLYSVTSSQNSLPDIKLAVRYRLLKK